MSSRLARTLRRPLAARAASALAGGPRGSPACVPSATTRSIAPTLVSSTARIGAGSPSLAPPAVTASLIAQRAAIAAASSATLAAKRPAGGSSSGPSSGSPNPESASSSSSSDLARARRGDRYDEITDKWIPEKPVSATEAGGYTLVIAAGLAVALGAIWFSLKELILEPKEQAVFNAALKMIETDPRIAVRVGSPMTGYGGEGRSRSARRQLAHSTHVDGRGVEHVRVQGAVRGPSGKGRVHADAFKGEGGGWEFAYLVVDVGRDRIVVAQPKAGPAIMRGVEG